MNCTKYDNPIPYNASILYNGVCVIPPTPTPAFQGGGYAYPVPLRKKKKKKENEEDEVIAMMLAEFLEDEN